MDAVASVVDVCDDDDVQIHLMRFQILFLRVLLRLVGRGDLGLLVRKRIGLRGMRDGG